jgi:ABC-type transport system involved in cytochrome c biogenesis permease subunit
MLENIELGLFAGAVALYVAAWAWHLAGWKRTSTAQTGVAVRVLWVGWVLHVGMVGLRWYRADHVPMLSAFEFVTFFAMLVIGILLMIYAAFMPKTVEPELSIFKGMLLQVHILTTLLGYAAWAVTFAASICYLYLEKKEDKNPGLFDQMAYRAAFFAFAFLTLGIITGALWGDRVFGQLWFWDPKETWSFITWLIFMAYLHARYTLEWRGRRAAILAIVGFAALVFTYVGVDFLLPQIHGVSSE